jgi:hypothetical protein
LARWLDGHADMLVMQWSCSLRTSRQHIHIANPYIDMVLSTTIFRVGDGLPLAASVDDENVSK